MLDVNRLRVIDAVARTGSVTAAAKALHCSQPSVTHHLARLEAETGAQLLQRVGRGVRLTPAGQLLADRAAEILGRIDAAGADDGYRSHILHAEPGGAFSIIGLVWRPGQITRIHDHLTWCVFGVIQGIEHEELFDAELNLLGESDNHTGDVSGFAPPGDIHRVHNISDETAISIHIYGTDVTATGSSVRRFYD